MRGLFKNWKFIFVLTVLIICLFFYIFMLQDRMKPPSKLWSRGVLINEVEDARIKETTKVRVVTLPIISRKEFITLWNEKDCIKYVLTDENGTMGVVKKIGYVLDEPNELRGVISDKEELNFYSLEGQILKQYYLSIKTNSIKFERIIEKKVNHFTIQDNKLFIVGDKFVKYSDLNGNTQLICNIGGNIIDAVKKNNDKYMIAFVATDKKGTLHIKYTEFSPNIKTNKVYEVGYQISSTNETSDVDNLVTGLIGNRTYIMVSRKQQAPKGDCRYVPKLTSTRTILYSFRDYNMKNVSQDYVEEIFGESPNPIRVYHDTKEIDFLATVMSIKGNDTEMNNIKQFALKDGVIEDKGYVTRTFKLSVNPNWFTIGDKNYVQWEEKTGTSTRLLFASTNSTIIKAAGKIKGNDAFEAFLDSLMPIGFSFSYLLLIFTFIVVPTLVFAFLASFLFLEWVENNHLKATRITVLIHICVEMLFAYYLAIKKPLVLELNPIYLQNSISRYLIILGAGLVCYYCLRLRYRDKKLDKTFINQYSFFAILNMILFSILIFPYYYI